MPLTAAQVAAGVPLLPGRARYNIVTDRSSTWIFHRMASGNLDGTYTQNAVHTDPTLIDPTIIDGIVTWSNLTHGGLFTMLAGVGRSMVVEGIAGGATFSTVDRAGNVLKTSFSATDLPMKLAPYETIKATSASAAGVLVRIDDSTIL